MDTKVIRLLQIAGEINETWDRIETLALRLRDKMRKLSREDGSDRIFLRIDPVGYDMKDALIVWYEDGRSHAFLIEDFADKDWSADELFRVWMEQKGGSVYVDD